jgi:hypothetical protein
LQSVLHSFGKQNLFSFTFPLFQLSLTLALPMMARVLDGRGGLGNRNPSNLFALDRIEFVCRAENVKIQEISFHTIGAEKSAGEIFVNS